MRVSLFTLTPALVLCSAAAVHGQAIGDLRIAVEHGDATDFSITPVWFGFHNGLFDSFDVGAPASAALEAIAELGDVGPVTADFSAAPGVPGDIQGVAAAGANGVPPIEPGETGVGYVTPVAPANYPYFSFLSMLVPTNDTFIGNSDPFAYEVFNSAGQLIDENGLPVAERVIEILGSDLYDAGTEVNGGGGAAFTQGQSGPDGVDENGLVALGSDLSSFLGATDVTGRVITDPIAPDEVLATIRISTVIPEPTSAALLLVAAGAAGWLRPRRAAA